MCSLGVLEGMGRLLVVWLASSQIEQACLSAVCSMSSPAQCSLSASELLHYGFVSATQQRCTVLLEDGRTCDALLSAHPSQLPAAGSSCISAAAAAPLPACRPGVRAAAAGDDAVAATAPAAGSEKPRCRYGHECYRQNAQHRADFVHPAPPTAADAATAAASHGAAAPDASDECMSAASSASDSSCAFEGQ